MLRIAITASSSLHLISPSHALQGAVHFEEGLKGADRVQRVLVLYNKAVSASTALPDTDREELSARSVTFADLNADAVTVERVTAAHSLLLRSLTPKAAAADSKKRPADSGAAGALHCYANSSVEYSGMWHWP